MPPKQYDPLLTALRTYRARTLNVTGIAIREARHSKAAKLRFKSSMKWEERRANMLQKILTK